MEAGNFKVSFWVKYSVSFFICGVLMSIFFFLRRSSLIGDGDDFNQYYPVYIYIGKYIRDILCGGGVIRNFDFRIGLGEDVIASLNYYGFGDVATVLAALVPVDYSERAYEAAKLLKYFFCGVSFIIYAKRYLHKDSWLLAGGLLYTFSTFSLFRGLAFWSFLNPMITFPLLLCGVDQIRENRKNVSVIFLFALFLQGMNGFYFLYMEIILVAMNLYVNIF